MTDDVKVLLLSRTEDNLVVGSSRARKSACWIIFRIAISSRATLLKEPREICWSAVAGVAAILIGFEHSARVVTASRCFQLVRTLTVDVGGASDHLVAST